MVDGPQWRTGAADCVEIAETGDLVGVRHSADPEGPVLWLTRGEWDSFLAAVKRGDFGLDR